MAIGDPCQWCDRIRPDHEKTCPVRVLAQGIADTMNASPGSVTHFRFDLPDTLPPDPDDRPGDPP